MKQLAGLLKWVLKAAIFFTLFAFALNNQQDATVHFFFGTQWRAPQVLDDAVQLGALRLDPATHRVTSEREGGAVELKIGPTEFRLLHFLMKHPERVHSRGQLLDRVWGDHVFIEERTVDVHIKRLREALSAGECAGMVETVRGAGYRLVVRPVATA